MWGATGRTRRATLAVLMSVLAVVAIACAGVGVALAGSSRGLASALLARDPGAGLGGDTIVGIDPGAHLLGVPGRPNFIIALATGETIRSGAQNDELGAQGKDVTIIADGRHQLVVGGPRGRLVARGGGHDLLFEPMNDASVLVQSPRDEVVLAGQRDRVVCAAHVAVTIYKRRSDSVSGSCRARGSRVLPLSQRDAVSDAGGVAAHTAAVTGDGSPENPYTAPCDTPSETDCTVGGFAYRKLRYIWDREAVPSYQCPADHRFLLNKDYAPVGTRLPLGVEVDGLGWVGVTLSDVISKGPFPTGTFNQANGRPIVYDIYYGTARGGQATDWGAGPNSYRVLLHCTSDLSHAARNTYTSPTHNPTYAQGP